MATKVYFDGTELTDGFICSNLVRRLLPRNVSTIEVPGMDGASFSNVTDSVIAIEMDMTALGTPAQRSAKLRTLTGLLDVREPKRLSFSDDGGMYYMAVPSGGELTRFIGAETVTVSFTCPSPAMYAAASTSVELADGTATFTVDGNYRTMPTIEVASATAGGDGYLTLELDGEDSISFALESSGSLSADCATRVAALDGDAILPTLGSDWLVLEPGEHTVEMTSGSGTCTLAYVERWL